MRANEIIQRRIAEILGKAAEKAEVNKAWVMERLKETVERAMQAVPHLDHEGNPTGVYTYQGNVAKSRSKAKANEPSDPRRGRPNRKAPS